MRTAKYAAHFREGYPSGQRGQTVNLLAYAFVGSNPTPSTSEGCGVVPLASTECGCSSMVELQPSKLVTWVRFPSPAPNPSQAHNPALWGRWIKSSDPQPTFPPLPAPGLPNALTAPRNYGHWSALYPTCRW